LPERIGSIKNPFIIPFLPPFNKGKAKGELLFFDVNIITKKVNEKKPLERSIHQAICPVPPFSEGNKKGLLLSQRQALPSFSSSCYFQ
jgi:hypothetical protein